MKQSFRGLPRMVRACLVVATGWPAAAAGQIPAGPPPVSAEPSGSSASGDVLVDSAIHALDRFHSISARVRLQARFFDHEIFGSGRYLQQGRGEECQVRWELSMPTSRTQNVMISVSNGRQWWRYLKTGEKEEQTVVDLTAIRAARADARPRDQGHRGLDTAEQGLAGTLQRLREHFEFAEATQESHPEGSFWVTRGGWRPGRLRQLLEGAQAPTSKAQTPKGGASLLSSGFGARLPREVVIFLHDGNLFPHRLEYLGSPPGAGERAQRYCQTTIEFFEIRFDGALEESAFQRPRELFAEDVTERHLRALQEVPDRP